MEIIAMFTMAEGLRGQAGHKRRILSKTVRYAALLGGLILTSIAVNALIVLADGNTRVTPAAIAEQGNAPACHDRLAHQLAPHPFKGANAPAHGCSL
jgi:hypothetical protein